MLKKTFLILLSVCLFAGALCFPDTMAVSKTDPVIDGMFACFELTAPMSAGNLKPWGQAEWSDALAKMAAVGMDKVIVQYTAMYYGKDTKYFFYPQTFDTGQKQPDYRAVQCEYLLKAAKDNNMKVYMGLQLAEDLWFFEQSRGFTDEDFLKDSAEFSIGLAEDLWKVFGSKYGSVIEGWYLPFEFTNNENNAASATKLSEQYYTPVTAALKELTPGKLTMSSPLVYTNLLIEPTKAEIDRFKEFFTIIWESSQLDIMAPQDGCGWESTVKEGLPPWYKAMAEVRDSINPERAKKGFGQAMLWNNPESYSMNGVNPMPTRRLIENISIIKQYVDKNVSFSIHRFIPMAKDLCGADADSGYYYNAYKYYIETGRLYEPSTPIPAPGSGSAAVENTYDVKLAWNRVEVKNQPVAGYVIKRRLKGDDKSVIKVMEISQPDDGQVTYTDCQVPTGREYEYMIYAFDGTGNRSDAAVIPVSLPATGYENEREYSENIAENIKIDVTAKRNIKLEPGDIGIESLNDGRLPGEFRILEFDKANFVSLKTENKDETGSFEILLSGIAKKKVGFLYLNILYKPELSIGLPEKIEVYADGVSVPIAVVYPAHDSKSIKSGGFWQPVALEELAEPDSLRIAVTQKSEYVMMSEIRLYETAANPGNMPKSLVEGQYVSVLGYANSGDFKPDEHFRGVTMSSYDRKTDYLSTDYIMFKGSYATNVLTKGFSPAISWQEDKNYSGWLGIGGIGTSYQLSVDLREPSTVGAISCEWLQDRISSIYVPNQVEFYGDDGTGRLNLISRAQRPAIPQLDLTLPVSAGNCHRVEEKTMWASCGDGKLYTKIVIKVFPNYPSQWAYIRSIAVY